jgi:hypothetical protein
VKNQKDLEKNANAQLNISNEARGNLGLSPMSLNKDNL